MAIHILEKRRNRVVMETCVGKIEIVKVRRHKVKLWRVWRAYFRSLKAALRYIDNMTGC